MGGGGRVVGGWSGWFSYSNTGPGWPAVSCDCAAPRKTAGCPRGSPPACGGIKEFLNIKLVVVLPRYEFSRHGLRSLTEVGM